MRNVLALSLVSLTLTGVVSAQAPKFDFYVPLHTAPDDPISGPYGLWASGPDYKASFHDGFTFYPVRGPDRELVAWQWRTESIRVGNVELKNPEPAPTTTDWRHELDHGAVTEVYDVLRQGVEQSFVLERPVGPGDVIVTGRILGGLQAPVAAAANQALEFHDGLQAVVRYGKAVAFDASGRRTDVATSWDGTHIRLELDGSFLEGARYPVTIDPLLSSVSINTNFSAPVSDTGIAVDNSSSGGQVWIVATRRFSSGDYDGYGYVCNKNFSSYQPVFSDITTVYSTPRIDVAHVAGANHWVVTAQFDYSNVHHRLRIYYHDQGNTTLNSGVWRSLAPPAGRKWVNPEISGVRGTGNTALIVFEDETTGTPTPTSKRPYYILVRALTHGYDFAQPLGTFNHSGAQSSIAVVPAKEDANRWTVLWLEKDAFFGSGFDVWYQTVDRSGNLGTEYNLTNLGTDTIGNLAVAGDKDQSSSRLALAWTRVAGGTKSLEVKRLDLASGQPAAWGPTRTIASSSQRFYGNVHLAYDWQSGSHWALTHTSSLVFGSTSAYLTRLGHSGGVTESALLSSSNPKSPAVAFAKPAGTQRFLASVGVTQIAANRLVAHQFIYPTGATTIPYGTICHPGASLSANHTPFAGDEFFQLVAAPALYLDLVIFVVGFGPANQPLSPYGFPAACSLAVNPNGAFTFAVFNPNFFGSASFNLPLPDAPMFVGDLFVQAAVLPGAATPYVTPGLEVRVR